MDDGLQALVIWVRIEDMGTLRLTADLSPTSAMAGTDSGASGFAAAYEAAARALLARLGGAPPVHWPPSPGSG